MGQSRQQAIDNAWANFEHAAVITMAKARADGCYAILKTVFDAGFRCGILHGLNEDRSPLSQMRELDDGIAILRKEINAIDVPQAVGELVERTCGASPAERRL